MKTAIHLTRVQTGDRNLDDENKYCIPLPLEPTVAIAEADIPSFRVKAMPIGSHGFSYFIYKIRQSHLMDFSC